MGPILAYVEALLLVSFRAICLCFLALAMCVPYLLFYLMFFSSREGISATYVFILGLIGLVLYCYFCYITIRSYFENMYWPFPLPGDEDSAVAVIGKALPSLPYLAFRSASRRLPWETKQFYYPIYAFFCASFWFPFALLFSTKPKEIVPNSELFGFLLEAVKYTIDLFLKGVVLDFPEHFRVGFHSALDEQDGLIFLAFTFTYRTLAGLVTLAAILRIADAIRAVISKT